MEKNQKYILLNCMEKVIMVILVSTYFKIKPRMVFILSFFKFKIYNNHGVNVCREQLEAIKLKTFTNIKNHNLFTISRNFKNKNLKLLKPQFGLLIFHKVKQKLRLFTTYLKFKIKTLKTAKY
jgi:hypothetical protein